MSDNMKRMTVLLLVFQSFAAFAGSQKWQQQADYKMVIDFDAVKNQFSGSQTITYHNNSPDTLTRIFYHLYFNAFQPGSMMDVRSRTIADPDGRIGDRIQHLTPDEIGYLKIKSLKIGGTANDFETVGTILEVTLKEPILPKQVAKLEMTFDGQVPIQIRRSGRDNKEGISYSMSQWYPKLAEYDQEGWHADPYVAREFYGVWGNFDVTIFMDPKFIIGATGILQNPQEVGYGYEKPGMKVNRPKGKLKWNFVANNVHDFVWAADPDYIHDVVHTDFGVDLHFFYQNDSSIIDNWKQLPEYVVKAFKFMNDNFGQYPYPKFSFIQGGDGGMEYPMATLIVGNGSLRGLIGVSTHEMIHSWFYGVLANNESIYPWMDEGFTNFATNLTLNQILDMDREFPFERTYKRYFSLAESGKEEPMSTHSDHYDENRSYSTSAYQKGAILLNQLDYILGHETFMKGMKRYFNTYKFRHPDVTDFKRTMELVSNLELDWYFEYFVNSTKTINYGIQSVVSSSNSQVDVKLVNDGKMPMPLDIQVEFTDGSRQIFYIPLVIMRGAKPAEDLSVPRTQLPDWPWTNPTYTFSFSTYGKKLKSIEIDPSERMADIDRTNNSIDIEAGLTNKLSNKD